MFFKKKNYDFLIDAPGEIFQSLRKKILNSLLTIFAVVGLPAVLIALVEAIHIGQYVAAAVYFVMYGLVFAAALLKDRIPYAYSVFAILSASFAIAIYNLYLYGFSGAGIPMLLTIFVIATVFFGLKSGVISIFLSLIPMGLVAWALIEHKHALSVDLHEITHLPISWITAIAVTAFLGSIIVFSFGALQRRLVEAMEKIAKQGADLQKSNETLRREAETRKKILADLRRAKEEAERSDNLKTSFLANMNHEIRTPMNALLGFSNLMKNEDLTEEEMREFAGIIHQSSRRLLRIIDDVIDVSVIESGNINLNPVEINLSIFFSDIFVQLAAGAKEKNLVASTNVKVDDSFAIITDYDRLTQIFNCLCDNALKFTEKGGVEIGCQSEPRGAFFWVKDTGAGIEPKHRELIFERFKQIENYMTKNFSGNGLGLSITKALVEALGGEIWLESELGAGSTFYFKLPLQYEQKDSATEATFS